MLDTTPAGYRCAMSSHAALLLLFRFPLSPDDQEPMRPLDCWRKSGVAVHFITFRPATSYNGSSLILSREAIQVS